MTPPKKPGDLKGEAAKVWGRIVQDLKGTVSASDGIALLALVRWWIEFQRIEEATRKATVGSPEHGRLLRALSTATKGFSAFAQRFGLTPTDREKLPPPQDPQSRSADPRERFFQPAAKVQKRPPTKLDKLGRPKNHQTPKKES